MVNTRTDRNLSQIITVSESNDSQNIRVCSCLSYVFDSKAHVLAAGRSRPVRFGEALLLSSLRVFLRDATFDCK